MAADTVSVFDVTTFGAVGDYNPATGAGTDNFEPIQDAMAALAAAGGGVIYFPPGRYVSSVDTAPTSYNAVIEAVNHTTVLFDPAAALHITPGITSRYFLVRAADVNDVEVIGATLVGWNDPTLEAEQAHGIMLKSVVRGSVRDCLVSSMRHDGIYVGGGPGMPSTEVRITGTTVDRAGRNGLRIAHAHDLLVTRSRFVNTGGIPEEAGVDFEPEEGYLNEDVRFVGNLAADNRTSGVTISSRPTQIGLLLAENTIRDNGTYGINCGTDGLLFQGNVISRNGAAGLKLGGADCVVSGNTFTENGTVGIDFVSVCDRTVVVGNRFAGNVDAPFDRGYAAGTLVADNAAS